jgi:hypothetical protein
MIYYLKRLLSTENILKITQLAIILNDKYKHELLDIDVLAIFKDY